MEDTLTPTVVEMIQFIRARLDERALLAEVASLGAPWQLIEGGNAHQVLVSADAIRDNKLRYGRMGHVATVEHLTDAQHIAANSPARVLAQIEATRKIVANAATALDHGWQLGEEARAAVAGIAVRTLQHLVELDANHPDYDPAWLL